MVKKNDKYLLDKSESKIAGDGKTKLYRLIAGIDFELKSGIKIKRGDKGGWLSSLKLKSGDARVFGNAWVFGNAEVSGNARVSGDAEVYGNARVSGDALVSGDAEVSGRFDLKVNCDFELPRIIIDSKEKLEKLKLFLDEF